MKLTPELVESAPVRVNALHERELCLRGASYFIGGGVRGSCMRRPRAPLAASRARRARAPCSTLPAAAAATSQA